MLENERLPATIGETVADIEQPADARWRISAGSALTEKMNIAQA